MLPMTSNDRLVWAWGAFVSGTLAYVYLLSHFQPERNKLTKFVTKWTNRRYTRFEFIQPRIRTLFVGLLLAILFFACAIGALVGIPLSR